MPPKRMRAQRRERSEPPPAITTAVAVAARSMASEQPNRAKKKRRLRRLSTSQSPAAASPEDEAALALAPTGLATEPKQAEGYVLRTRSRKSTQSDAVDATPASAPAMPPKVTKHIGRNAQRTRSRKPAKADVSDVTPAQKLARPTMKPPENCRCAQKRTQARKPSGAPKPAQSDPSQQVRRVSEGDAEGSKLDVFEKGSKRARAEAFTPVVNSWVTVKPQKQKPGHWTKREQAEASTPALISFVSQADQCATVIYPNRLALLHGFGGDPVKRLAGVPFGNLHPLNTSGADLEKLQERMLDAICKAAARREPAPSVEAEAHDPPESHECLQADIAGTRPHLAGTWAEDTGECEEPEEKHEASARAPRVEEDDEAEETAGGDEAGEAEAMPLVDKAAVASPRSTDVLHEAKLNPELEARPNAGDPSDGVESALEADLRPEAEELPAQPPMLVSLPATPLEATTSSNASFPTLSVTHTPPQTPPMTPRQPPRGAPRCVDKTTKFPCPRSRSPSLSRSRPRYKRGVGAGPAGGGTCGSGYKKSSGGPAGNASFEAFTCAVARAFRKEGSRTTIQNLVQRLSGRDFDEFYAGMPSQGGLWTYEDVKKGLRTLEDRNKIYIVDDLVFSLAC